MVHHRKGQCAKRRKMIGHGHSFEQYYQGCRRCWRFGQEKPVTVDIVTTKGCMSVLKNLQRKAKQAEVLYSELIANMAEGVTPDKKEYQEIDIETPSWMKKRR